MDPFKRNRLAHYQMGRIYQENVLRALIEINTFSGGKTPCKGGLLQIIVFDPLNLESPTDIDTCILGTVEDADQLNEHAAMDIVVLRNQRRGLRPELRRYDRCILALDSENREYYFSLAANVKIEASEALILTLAKNLDLRVSYHSPDRLLIKAEELLQHSNTP